MDERAKLYCNDILRPRLDFHRSLGSVLPPLEEILQGGGGGIMGKRGFISRRVAGNRALARAMNIDAGTSEGQPLKIKEKSPTKFSSEIVLTISGNYCR